MHQNLNFTSKLQENLLEFNSPNSKNPQSRKNSNEEKFLNYIINKYSHLTEGQFNLITKGYIQQLKKYYNIDIVSLNLDYLQYIQRQKVTNKQQKKKNFVQILKKFLNNPGYLDSENKFKKIEQINNDQGVVSRFANTESNFKVNKFSIKNEQPKSFVAGQKYQKLKQESQSQNADRRKKYNPKTLLLKNLIILQDKVKLQTILINNKQYTSDRARKIKNLFTHNLENTFNQNTTYLNKIQSDQEQSQNQRNKNNLMRTLSYQLSYNQNKNEKTQSQFFPFKKLENQNNSNYKIQNTDLQKTTKQPTERNMNEDEIPKQTQYKFTKKQDKNQYFTNSQNQFERQIIENIRLQEQQMINKLSSVKQGNIFQKMDQQFTIKDQSQLKNTNKYYKSELQSEHSIQKPTKNEENNYQVEQLRPIGLKKSDARETRMSISIKSSVKNEPKTPLHSLEQNDSPIININWDNFELRTTQLKDIYVQQQQVKEQYLKNIEIKTNDRKKSAFLNNIQIVEQINDTKTPSHSNTHVQDFQDNYFFKPRSSTIQRQTLQFEQSQLLNLQKQSSVGTKTFIKVDSPLKSTNSLKSNFLYPKDIKIKIEKDNMSQCSLNSNKKGMLQLQQEFGFIMEALEIEIKQSKSLNNLLSKHDILQSNLIYYLDIFLQITLLERINLAEKCVEFKVNYQIFIELEQFVQQVLKKLDFDPIQISLIIQEKIQGNKKLIQYGLLIDELGSVSGLYKIVTESLPELNLRMPKQIQLMDYEQKIQFFSRLIMAVCNSEFNKLDFGENIKYFKDFGSREFYSLKEILWVTFRLKNVNYLTIQRFMELLEKARYVISNSLIINQMIEDTVLYEQLCHSLNWQISCNLKLNIIFLGNQELLSNFCHSILKEFIYNQQGKFQLYFLIQNMQINTQQLQLIVDILVQIIENKGLEGNFSSDIRIKMKKLIWRLNLDKNPLQTSQIQTIELLMNELNYIMVSDIHFQSFIGKFREEKKHLILESNETIYNSKGGLKLLLFSLIELFSDHDYYSILDIKAGLQIYSLNKIILIQWKTGIELALKNLNLSSWQKEDIINTISEQFSLIYEGVSNEKFNQILQN